MPPPMMARRRGCGEVVALVVVVGAGWPFVCGVDMVAVWIADESWNLLDCCPAGIYDHVL